MSPQVINWLISLIIGFVVFTIGWAIFLILANLIQKKAKVKKALDRVVLRVLVPKEELKEVRDPKELIAQASQLFASLYDFKKGWKSKILGQDWFSFEILCEEKLITFYVSCPVEKRELIEKQITAIYPSAILEEVDLPNIFPEKCEVAAASLGLAKSSVYPIKTYKALEVDPLNSITNALAKLSEEEGAGIQILIRPASDFWRKQAEKRIKELQEGKKPKKFSLGESIITLGKSLAAPPSSKEGEKIYQPTPIEEEIIKAISEKSAQVGYETLIRIVVASQNKALAEMHLNNIIGAFVQFTDPNLNKFKKLKEPKNKTITNFAFRLFPSQATKTILTPDELASIFHFPNKFVESPNIHWLLAKRLPPPANVPKEGISLGYNIYRGIKTEIKIKDNDLRRHFYLIGRTGTGKTTLMLRMIIQNIKRGDGVCYIDPHGDAAEFILQRIPKERADDVIYFDPSDTARPMGFNLLEAETPEQKDFIVQELVSIFYKLFGTEMIGPKFEHWTRNAALTLMESNDTLIEIPRIFTDKEFERSRVEKVKDPVVRSFWEKEYAQTTDFHKSEMLGYFVSRFGRFITNDMMRNIIGQRKSSFDIREIMDEGKIFIVNLSKGKIGDVNGNLLGLILVSKIQMAAMARAELPPEKRRDFYLYIDEFQNFTTDSIAVILAEARKYGLIMCMAHQYIAQLQENIRDAVLGNAGNIACYRIGVEDAEVMAKEMAPLLSETDLVNIEKFNFYLKMLIDGTATKPFNVWPGNIYQDPEYAGDPKLGEAIRQLSRLKYGRDREIVAAEIYERTKY